MQIVILAGGLGTRIQSIAGNIPKSLIPVAGKPFIEHQIDLLKQNCITNLLLCVGFLADQIEAHLGDGKNFGINIKYSRENGDRLLGTGGALVNALPLLDDAFLLLYGDSYLPVHYQDIISNFKQQSATAMMCVYRNLGLLDKSNVRTEGDYVSFYSKTANPSEVDYIDYGLIAFKRNVIENYIQHPMPLDLQSILQDQVSRKRLHAYVVTERFYEIGKVQGFRDFELYLGSKSR